MVGNRIEKVSNLCDYLLLTLETVLSGIAVLIVTVAVVVSVGSLFVVQMIFFGSDIYRNNNIFDFINLGEKKLLPVFHGKTSFNVIFSDPNKHYYFFIGLIFTVAVLFVSIILFKFLQKAEPHINSVINQLVNKVQIKLFKIKSSKLCPKVEIEE